MYGSELSSVTLPDIKDGIDTLNLKYEDAEKLSRKMAKKLYDENVKLFRRLTTQAQDNDSEEESERRTADIDVHSTRHLRNIRDISDRLIELLSSEPAVGNSAGRKSQIVWELKQIHGQAAVFARHSELICWLETDDKKRLCAIPKDLDKRLFNDIWNKGIPTVFTSGTLSTKGDFSHIKRSLGIERAGIRLVETSKPSPFNHRENTLL